MLKQIRDEQPDVDLLEDFPDKPVSIHKIEREEDQEGGKIDFPLVEQGARTSLGDRSHIIRKLPAGFRIGYVFADVVDVEQRRELSQRCRELFDKQN